MLESNQKLAGVQTAPLSVSSGGSALQRKLAEHNKALAMMKAQTRADTEYDPVVPKRPTEAKFVENYCGSAETDSMGPMVATVALLGILGVLLFQVK
jgi:hypothetical protein